MACVNEFVNFALGIEEGDSEIVILENILSIYHAKTDFKYLSESNLIEILNFLGNIYKGEIEYRSKCLIRKWRNELMMEKNLRLKENEANSKELSTVEDEMLYDLLVSLEDFDHRLNQLFSDYVYRYTRSKRKREDDSTGWNPAKMRKVVEDIYFSKPKINIIKIKRYFQVSSNRELLDIIDNNLRRKYY